MVPSFYFPFNFFLKVEKLERSELTAQEIKILELFAKEINNGKRCSVCPTELEIEKAITDLKNSKHEKERQHSSRQRCFTEKPD
jgi:CO dehydrogenase/acetyl-CoA synthase alpha subunit